MNWFIHRMLGNYLQEEAGGADLGSAPAAPAAAQPATPTSLLGSEPAPAPAADQAPADPAATAEADPANPAEDSKPEEVPGAPEAYEPFTLPEGVAIDEAVMPDVHALFKELGLPQDKAGEVLGKLLAIQEKLNGTPEQQQEAMHQQVSELNAGLAEQCKALPGIGGENFNQSLETASKVMLAFGTPELRDLVTYTAVGSHPEFFKFIHAIGSKMSPDVFEHGGESAKTSQRPADVMFGDLFNK